jgi:hypothetical protein
LVGYNPSPDSLHQMAIDNDLYSFLPKEILSQIFCQYLLLEGISRFDVAICNNEKRPGYLEVIGSIACIWRGDTERQFSYEGISWLSNRNIRIRSLWVRDVVNDDTAIKIASFGAHLLQLDINENCVSDIDMIKIVEGCRNIESLSISDCQSITDISISRIAECCPNLNELLLTGCHNITDTSMIKLAVYCPHVKALSMSGCLHITDTSIIKLAECCHSIESLDISGCANITDTSVMKLAE